MIFKTKKKIYRLKIRKSSHPSLILNSKFKILGLSKFRKFRPKFRKLSLKLKNKIKLAFKARIKKLILESKVGKIRIRKKKSLYWNSVLKLRKKERKFKFSKKRMLKLKIKVGKTQLFLLKTRARKKTRKKKYYVYKPSKKSLNVNVDNIYYHFDRNIFQFHKKKIILNNFWVSVQKNEGIIENLDFFRDELFKQLKQWSKRLWNKIKKSLIKKNWKLRLLYWSKRFKFNKYKKKKALNKRVENLIFKKFKNKVLFWIYKIGQKLKKYLIIWRCGEFFKKYKNRLKNTKLYKIWFIYNWVKQRIKSIKFIKFKFYKWRKKLVRFPFFSIFFSYFLNFEKSVWYFNSFFDKFLQSSFQNLILDFKKRKILNLVISKFLYLKSVNIFFAQTYCKDYFGCINTQKFSYQIINFVRENLLKQNNVSFRNELDLFISYYDGKFDKLRDPNLGYRVINFVKDNSKFFTGCIRNWKFKNVSNFNSFSNLYLILKKKERKISRLNFFLKKNINLEIFQIKTDIVIEKELKLNNIFFKIIEKIFNFKWQRKKNLLMI